MFNRNIRRAAIASASALTLGLGAAVWATSASAASAAPATSTPRCTAADLSVWVNVGEANGAAGTIYYPLEFTNVSNHTCRVRGYPGVSATSATGKQLGDAAGRQGIWPPAWVNIVAGGTVHALFGYGAAEVSTSNCKPKTASFLKVFAPNQTSALHAFFDYQSCTSSHHPYLFVSVIRPGSAI